MATWSDGEDSSFEEESQEEANLYLMAHHEEINTENSLDFTFDELQEAFFELMAEYKKVTLKNKDLRKLNLELTHEKKIFFEKLNLYLYQLNSYL